MGNQNVSKRDSRKEHRELFASMIARHQEKEYEQHSYDVHMGTNSNITVFLRKRPIVRYDVNFKQFKNETGAGEFDVVTCQPDHMGMRIYNLSKVLQYTIVA